MEIIINILGAAAFGFLAADFLTRFDWLPDKPWKCNMCLTFWLTLYPFILMYGWHGILVSSLAALISEIMYRWI